ncbi:MAG: efflux RND transporter periplasmic adaptor subunit [Fimbriimonadaceae bacterium]|nr:efflux RND transporter periplasmic adaptor subunit [Fimbriimonadaceae bacterium]
MKSGYWVGIGALVAFCAFGGFAVQQFQKTMNAKKDKKPEVTVQRGEVSVSVIENGTLNAIKSVEVKSRVSGRVAKLLVDEGDEVEAGQLIAVIDPQETQLQVQQNAAQVRGAQAGVERAGIEIEQRRVTAQTALQRAEATLRQVQLELKAQPTLTSAAVQAAESALVQAEESERQLISVTQSNARVTATTSVQDAQANLKNASDEMDRQRQLLDKGYVARRSVQEAEVQLQLAQSRLANAKESLSTLEASQNVERKLAAERVRQAEADLDRAKANSIQDGVKREQYRQAQAAVREARAQLKDVGALQASRRQQAATVEQLSTVLRDGQRQLGETRIVAPISGVVTKRYMQIGELVASLNSFSAGSPIFRIEDRSKMLVKLQVNEIDVAKLRIGMPAKITVDAAEGQTLAGKVAKIAPTSIGAIQTAPSADPVVKYEVEVTVLDPGAALKTGMSAKCAMKVIERKNVLRVPVDYLGQDGEKYFLMIRAEGSKPEDKGKRTPVEIGERSQTHVEITKGAAEGAILALPAFSGPERKGMMSFGPEEGEE